MATLAQKKRSGKSGGHDNKTAHRQAEEKKDSPAQRKVMRSAYLQTKMAVSTPGDTQEQEADRVAEEVSRMPKGVARAADETAPPGSSQPENNAEQPQSLQTKISRMGEEPETARTKLCRAEAENLDMKAARSAEENLATQLHRSAKDEPVQTKLFRDNLEEANPTVMRSEEEDATAQAKLHRQEEEPTNTETDTEAASPQTPIVADETEQKIESLRGQGNPMADDIRQDMEGKLHADFSRVSIHTSGDADALCKQLSARAFTVGNDIFFAAGEYAPTTEAGRKLLAHELTHVIQQQNSIRKLHRSIYPADTPDGNAQAQTQLRALSTLNIPPIKQRHLPMYSQLARDGNLGRVMNYTRSSPAQSSVWKQSINIAEEDIVSRLHALTPAVNWPASENGLVNFRLANPAADPQSFPKQRFLNSIIKVPKWDRRGNYISQYQVDHIIELQTSGAHGSRTAVGNSIENMELLDQPSNGSSGAIIMNGIYSNVVSYLNTLTPIPSPDNWLREHNIIFDNVVVGRGGDRSEGDSSWWTLEEIRALDHLNALRGAPPALIDGNDRNFVLASGPGGVEIGRFAHNRTQTEFAPRGRSSRAVAGLEITSIALNATAEQDNSGSEIEIGTLTANWDLPAGWQPATAQTTMPIYGLGPYSGYLLPRSSLDAHFAHASPASFTDLSIGAEGVTAGGAITPSIPLFANLDLSLEMLGDDIIFRTEYMPDNLDLNFPGLNIYAGSIGLSYGKLQGFGVDGSIYFSVPNLGTGSLAAGFTQRNGFSAEGNFNFDSELFDRASVSLWYRSNTFGGEGTIGIDSPDKIRGIRAAEITVGFGENSFTASGLVSPNIPGVEEAGLNIAYNEEGLVIGGTLALNQDTPGIESGEVEVTLSKLDDEWKVVASGSAVPSIPGINSELTVSYNDGAFTAEIEADYSRGMLSGRVNAGVTNRSVSEDGQTLTETAEPDNPLIVYGGGSLSLQLAPWLQATAGVQFSPNGEITVTGEIGLPDELEIFARREINKSIFNIAVQAPIFPGIVAEIGGGLSATAGIGPGVIDQLRLGVTYNPDHEEDTHITGDAHLNIPANAGLRLSVRAGIGLGITGASATGGLDIGGTLGIEGAAEAGVHVDWTPTTGLAIEAEVAVHAQPSFTFDIGGYVSVRALGFSVYDERWEFASYTFGSDYRFGIRLPIHYREGEPFDISLDDVEFEVPDIDTDQLLRGLVARIA